MVPTVAARLTSNGHTMDTVLIRVHNAPLWRTSHFCVNLWLYLDGLRLCDSRFRLAHPTQQLVVVRLLRRSALRNFLAWLCLTATLVPIRATGASPVGHWLQMAGTVDFVKGPFAGRGTLAHWAARELCCVWRIANHLGLLRSPRAGPCSRQSLSPHASLRRTRIHGARSVTKAALLKQAMLPCRDWGATSGVCWRRVAAGV